MTKYKRFSGEITAKSVFYIAFALYMFSCVFLATGLAYSEDDSMTSLLWVLKAIRYLSYLLFICKIILDNRHIKKGFFSLLAGLLLLTFLSIICSKDKQVLFFLLIFIAAKDVSAKRLVQCVFTIQMAVLVATVLCSQMGFVKDYIVVESFRARHYLGFRWVSFAPGFFFFILLEYLFLKNGRITPCKYILFMIGNFWLFQMTGTRLAFLASLFFGTFSLFVFQNGSTIHLGQRLWMLFFIFLPWLCAGFSIWCHIAYDFSNPIWAKVNTLLSGRLRLGNSAIKQYGFTLCGQKIEWISQSIISVSSEIKGYNYVDCSYLQIALQYGMIILLLILFSCSFLMIKAFRRKQYYLCWILAAIFIYSMVEPRLLHSWYNPFLLLCLSILPPDRKNIPTGQLSYKMYASNFSY